MKVSFSRKTISIPTYLANRLDQVSERTGYSVSNIIQKELAKYLYRFESQAEPESMEHWLERIGRSSKYDGSEDAYLDQLLDTGDD